VAVPKNPVFRDNGKAADELEGNIVCTQGGALEGATGDRVLEEAGINQDLRGDDFLSSKSVQLTAIALHQKVNEQEDDLLNESTELTAITLHQPWASLIAAGHKQYETRDWPTNHRGPIAIHAGRKPKGKQELREHDKVLASFKDLLTEDCPYSSVIAIAQLTDVVCMTKEFIEQQSAAELRCGNWAVGRYAFKLENVRAIEPIPAVGKQGLWKWEHKRDWQKEFFGIDDSIKYLDESDSWNPAEFGELQHIAEADGQLNLLEWVDPEPPEPGDYEFREEFEERFKEWAARQTDEAEEELANFGVEELCSQLKDGLTCAAESEPVFPTPESDCGEEALISSASGTATANKSSKSDSPAQSNLPTSNSLTSSAKSPSPIDQESSQLPPPANLSATTGTDLPQMTTETASLTYFEQSEKSSPTSQLSKTLADSLPAPIPPATNLEPTSDSSSTPYPRAGTMQNGVLSAAPTLPPPGVESDSLLLRSPGGLSGSAGVRPPGKTKLETQLNQSGLIQNGEVVAPEFLEAGYNLPVGWTNPQEKRTAIKLAQQSSLDPKSESPAETEPIATEGPPSEMRSTGELQPLGLNELNISVILPPNIGALSKAELIGMASEQHQLICGIERKQFKLAFEKLYRIHVTGLFLMEFKKRCQYGEFVEQLEAHGINPRVAQNYMMVSKNWETIEAKAHQSALLSENNEFPNLGINWVLQVIREEKKQLKSAAPPKDPDSWRTPCGGISSTGIGRTDLARPVFWVSDE
jgi:hypothetical protein